MTMSVPFFLASCAALGLVAGLLGGIAHTWIKDRLS